MSTQAGVEGSEQNSPFQALLGGRTGEPASCHPVDDNSVMDEEANNPGDHWRVQVCWRSQAFTSSSGTKESPLPSPGEYWEDMDGQEAKILFQQ